MESSINFGSLYDNWDSAIFITLKKKYKLHLFFCFLSAQAQQTEGVER